jgi:hypothetical protein
MQHSIQGQGPLLDGYVGPSWNETYTQNGNEIRYVCNGNTTGAGDTLTYVYCEATSADILIEGYSHPPHEPSGTGLAAPVTEPGRCDVTTGSATGPLWGDNFNMIGYFSNAMSPPECAALRTKYLNNCIKWGTGDAGVKVVAHSMGAIAASAFGLPVDYQIGSVGGVCTGGNYGIGGPCSMRNNDDPIPTIAAGGQIINWLPTLVTSGWVSSCGPFSYPSVTIVTHWNDGGSASVLDTYYNVLFDSGRNTPVYENGHQCIHYGNNDFPIIEHTIYEKVRNRQSYYDAVLMNWGQPYISTISAVYKTVGPLPSPSPYP